MHSQLSSASSTESFRLTSQIQGQFNSAIYRCSSNNELSRLPVKQQYHADGKLYIEYIPGHNVLFLPTAIPIEAPIKKLRKSQRQKEAQAIQKPIELAKPNNAFIRYRSYRLRDIKQLYPQANQTDLSRIAAEYWRTEDPKIKEFFQKQYKEALQFYHQKLKIQHLAAKYHAQSRSVALPPSNPEEQLQAAANSSATSSSAETSDTDSPVLLTLKRRRSLSAPPEVSDLFSIKRICK
ncbi:hypothetical protein IWW36_001547 [Coemansia brasiliensis]|uniref:HMG box domain-containing protein n=1 Tax=Coemansia brasiliensis TaxID=2650707 RepID=A0A9W8M1G7_9FUNG|nr:hypothetical protein IWW36_001547 [Coemansia brasiliensis]